MNKELERILKFEKSELTIAEYKSIEESPIVIDMQTSDFSQVYPEMMLVEVETNQAFINHKGDDVEGFVCYINKSEFN